MLLFVVARTLSHICISIEGLDFAATAQSRWPRLKGLGGSLMFRLREAANHGIRRDMFNMGSGRETLKKIGLGAAFVLVIASPEILHVAIASPVAKPAAAAQAANANTFVPTCNAAQVVVDTRPDPAWVGASFAHDNCWAPVMPVSINGASATRAQIVAGMAAEKRYDVQAAAYQRCISDFVVSRKAEADRIKKPIDVALVTIEDHRIAASENNKKKVAALTGNAIEAFNEFGSQCDD
jgi:hypothetical protein